MPHPSLVDKAKMGLRNVWNKYVSNDVSVWDRMYESGYQAKLDSAGQRPRHHVIAGLIADGCPAEPSVLDVGCGNGTMYRLLRSLGAHYLGIDLCPHAVSEAKREFAGDPRCSVEEKSLETFQTDVSYHAIVLNEVLYYLPPSQIDSLLARLKQGLKNERSLLIVSMSRNPKAAWLWATSSELRAPAASIYVRDDLTGNRWTVRTYRR